MDQSAGLVNGRTGGTAKPLPMIIDGTAKSDVVIMTPQLGVYQLLTEINFHRAAKTWR